MSRAPLHSALALTACLALPLLGDCAPAAPASAAQDPAGLDGPAPVARAAAPDLPWASWRGPLATGASPDATPPLTWSEDEHVRWRTELPGLGHSSPVVAGGRVFVTAAEEVGEPGPPVPELAPGAHDNATVTRRQRFAVIALDLATGDVLWDRTAREDLPHEPYHVSGSLASASPVTDGERVFAFFGSAGLFAYTSAGEHLWDVDLGDMQVKHAHGEGASPLLVEDTLVVNWDHEGPSFLVALDAATGDERWRVPRDEPTSWATPIAARVDGRTQVVVSGTNRVRGYDLADGAVLWECGGLSNNVVASPVFEDGVLYAGSSYEKQVMLALQLEGARGDLTVSDHLAWVRRRSTPYVPSPLLVDGALYFLHHYQGMLSRVDATTGEEPTGPFRLPEIASLYASPVAAAGRIYLTDLQGATLVLAAGPTPEMLAVNRLDDEFSASAALAGEALLLRGRRALYCLAED